MADKNKNLNSFAVEAFYNRKMCGVNDAKRWEDLHDIETLYLSANSSASVHIYTNGWATHITVSWVESSSNVRYITCGNKLNADTSMKKYINVVMQQS